MSTDSSAPSMISRLSEAVQARPVLAAMLAAGAIGGTAGGVLSAQRPKYRDEKPGDRRSRILRNALLIGGASAAGVGGMLGGGRAIMSAVPTDAPQSPTEVLLGTGTRLATGAAAGVGAHKLIGRGQDAKALSFMRELALRESAQRKERPVKRKVQGKKGDPSKTVKKTEGLTELAKSVDTALEDGVKTKHSPRQVLAAALQGPENTGSAGNVSGLGARFRAQLGMGTQLSPADAQMLQGAGINPAFGRTADPSMAQLAEGALGDGAKRKLKNPKLRMVVGTGARVLNRGNLLRAGAATGGFFAPDLLMGGINLMANRPQTLPIDQ